MIKVFSKKVLQEILYNDMFVEDRHNSSSRWSEQREIIFEWEGKYFSCFYSKGLTESQDEAPFEYDDDYIECMEVFEREVVTTTWVYLSDKVQDTKKVELEDFEKYCEKIGGK